MLRLVLVTAVVSLMPGPDVARVIMPESHQFDTKLLKDARNILKRFDVEYTTWNNKKTLATWNYFTNKTEKNEEAKLDAEWIPSILLHIGKEADTFAWKDLKDEHVKRQFEKLTTRYSKFTTTFLIEETVDTKYSAQILSNTLRTLKDLYDVISICDHNAWSTMAITHKRKSMCNLKLGKIMDIMKRSRNPEELKYTWVEWRKNFNEVFKTYYSIYVKYANIEARRLQFQDQAAFWMSYYEVGNFPEQIETLWQQLKPLYLQLHAYVRRELRKKYGEDIVSKDGPIPAHLLNLYTWTNIEDFTTPFPGKQMPNVTIALRQQGYNAERMFRVAENFFKSINLSAMTDTFWKKSILEKRKNVRMSCAPSAWDFSDGKDFRILLCTLVDMEYLLIAHHEMGHIEYYMQYKDQPGLFRDAANPGFHEAIGDVIYLSVSTPEHLKKIGLLKEDSIDERAFLNHLYLKSLEKIAYLPFAYIVDLWRWNVFQGKVTPDNYNCHWWSLAAKYQGIEPPVDRSEKNFDPGAIFFMILQRDYIRYFVSNVIQFQFHKALCIKAGQYNPNYPDAKPLHQCDIYGNKDAGNLLKSMMELGSSKPWPDAMEMITGQRQMDASGLLEYFQPLMDWLIEENKKTNEYIGWKSSNRRCVKTITKSGYKRDEL